MRTGPRIAAATLVLAVVVAATWLLTGPRSVAFAFVAVWAPMTWMGTISRWAPPRLPDRWYRLRPWERDGRVYRWLGVGVAKAVLRRGPLAAFNPHLHLPAEPTPEAIARLDGHMRVAEASHVLMGAVGLAVALHAAARGWWPAATWTVAFDVVLNGYPVLLQRANRARLAQRFG